MTPQVVGMPITSYESLIVIGTPWSGPQNCPRATAASASRTRATGALHVCEDDGVERRIVAFRTEPEVLERLQAPHFPARMSAARSTADLNVISTIMAGTFHLARPDCAARKYH